MSGTYEDVFALFQIAYPISHRPPDLMPAGQQYIPAWLDSGRTPQEVTDDLGQVVRALGGRVDPGGYYDSVRHDAFTGESDVSQLISPHEMDPLNVPMPTDQEIWARVYGTPPVEPPVKPPVEPPVQPPSGSEAAQDAAIAALQTWARGIGFKG